MAVFICSFISRIINYYQPTAIKQTDLGEIALPLSRPAAAVIETPTSKILDSDEKKLSNRIQAVADERLPVSFSSGRVNECSQAVDEPKEIRVQIAQSMVATIQRIAGDSMRRLDPANKDSAALKTGVYYPIDYLKALERTGNSKRLTWLVQKNVSYHCFVSPNHFNTVSAPAPAISIQFVLKPGVPAHEALEALLTGPSLIGCGEVCALSIYESLKNAWGIEKFDILFSGDSPTPLTVKFDDRWHPLKCFIKLAELPAQRGDIIRFSNTPEYGTIHPLGIASNYNTICCDPMIPSFTTLGLPSEGLTIDGMNQKLFLDCISEDDSFKFLTPEFTAEFRRHCPSLWARSQLAAKLPPEYRMTQKRFKEFGGGAMERITLDTERIIQIQQMEIKVARALLTSWNTTQSGLK